LARPGLDERAAVARLDGLAEHVRFRVDAGDPERVVADRLHDVLYREAGYRAPTAAEYGDPANSHLDAVLDRRIGLPISLAVVELETAWRARAAAGRRRAARSLHRRRAG
jgi:regulator of sirC expression with transglutaminase-like and TPR domain